MTLYIFTFKFLETRIQENYEEVSKSASVPRIELQASRIRTKREC